MRFLSVVVVAQSIKEWCEPLIPHWCVSAHSVIRTTAATLSIQPHHNYTLEMFAAQQSAQYSLDGRKQETFLSSVEYSSTLLYRLYNSQCSLSDFPSWSSNNMLLLSSIPNKWTAGLLPQWRKL